MDSERISSGHILSRGLRNLEGNPMLFPKHFLQHRGPDASLGNDSLLQNWPFSAAHSDVVMRGIKHVSPQRLFMEYSVYSSCS